MKKKIAIGFWAKPLVHLLARGRFLRGTPFDPFGVARVRRLERELSREYGEALDRVLPRLSEENFDAAVQLARLPDQVRGYEALKLARIETYRGELARAEAAIGGT